MIFGFPEVLEYQKECKDERVLSIIRMLIDSKNNSAKWCEHSIKMQEEIAELKKEIHQLKQQIEKD